MITCLEQILKANGEAKDHIFEEVDIENSISYRETKDMIFGSFEADKQFIEELARGCGGGSYACDEALQEIDGQIITNLDEDADIDQIFLYYGVASEGEGSKIWNPGVSNLPITNISSNNTVVEELSKRGSLET